MAINTPLGFDIPVVRLSRPGPDGERVDIPTIRLPSPWPDHFQVIGIDDGTGVDALDRWPSGEYTLELRIDPGGWVRTITIDVGASAEADPAPSPTGSPCRPR